MVGVVHREVFNTAALVIAADETLSRVVNDPALETLPLLIQFAGIEVQALELAVILQFRLEVRRRDTRPLIREVVFEVPEHFRALHPAIDNHARCVEVHLCPLVDTLAHLLAKRPLEDVVHRRHDGTLSRSCPSLLHRCQVEEDALQHEVVKEIPLLVVPVRKELVAEHVNRVPGIIEIVREAEVDDTFLAGARLTPVDGVVRRDVEFR